MIRSIYCSQRIWAELLVTGQYPTTMDFQSHKSQAEEKQEILLTEGYQSHITPCILCLDFMASLDEAWRDNGNRINNKKRQSTH